MGKGAAYVLPPASQRLKLRLRLSSTAGIHLLVTDNRGAASFTDQKILHRTFQAARNFLVTSGYSSPAESPHHPTAVSDDHRAVEIASLGHHQSVESDVDQSQALGVSSLSNVQSSSERSAARASLENQAESGGSEIQTDENVGLSQAVAECPSSHIQAAAAEEEIAGRSLQSQIQAEEGTLQYQAAAEEEENASRSLQSRAATEGRSSQIQAAAAAAECGSSEIQAAAAGDEIAGRSLLSQAVAGSRSSHIQAAEEDNSSENQAATQSRSSQIQEQSLRVQGAADGASADIQAAESVSGSLQIQAGASVKIQAVYRGYKARRILLQEKAALKIQLWFRGNRLRKDYLLQKDAARLIQAQTRGFLVRRILHRWGVAASSIQAAYKRYNRRILMREARSAAALKIQRWFRGRKNYLLQKNAVRLIQAHARGYLVRRMVNRWGVAARSIQHAWRLAPNVKAGSQLISSDVEKVAEYWNSSDQAAAESVDRSSQIQAATVKIQAVYRGHRIRQSSLVQKNAVRLIQAYSRGFLIRQIVHRWGVAARLIQQAWKLSRESKAASQRQQVQQVVSSETEDWNSFEVDRLGECLDTCLAEIGAKTAASSSGLNLPERDISAHRDLEACGYKQTLKERDLQQVARVFLLQHQISMQQQQAKHAPPFPPQEQQQQQLNCSMIRREVSIQKPSIEPQQQQHGGDVILDVQLLLEELQRRGYSPSCDSSLVFMELGRCEKQAVVGLKQINALLVIFVAVVIYTRSLCHGVILWAKQSATKK